MRFSPLKMRLMIILTYFNGFTDAKSPLFWYYVTHSMQKSLCWIFCEILHTKEIIMWTKPAATEMRYGFEVTMYVMNR
jgi:pyrroloquinoline quinone biosynthesis protein A